MTLIVAICINEEEGEQSILISSDSQATMGPITYRVHKIAPIREPIEGKEPIAIAAGAGDTAIIKKAIDISEQIIWEASNTDWENKTPTFDQFKQVISKIENALIQTIQFYKKCVDFNFEFLLGSVSPEGYASLYYFDGRGLAQPVNDDPGFACIGSGFFLGGNLLLQQFYSTDIDFTDAVHLTTYVINQVSMVDSNVGPFEGES
jgi:20S proteasome alpha/beta subunit